MTTDVFKFLSLRAADTTQSTAVNVKFIRDDYWRPDFNGHTLVRQERYIGSGAVDNGQLKSTVGKMIFDIIFDPANLLREFNDTNNGIFHEVLRNYFSGVQISPASTTPVSLYKLEKYPYIVFNGLYYSFPENPMDWEIAGIAKVGGIMELIETALKHPSLAENDLISDIEALVGKTITAFVFTNIPVPSTSVGDDDFLASYNGDIRENLYSSEFAQLKSLLFEALYAMYVVRRTISVNLELFMNALAALHVVEQLAIDDFVSRPDRSAVAVKPVLHAVVKTLRQTRSVIKTRKDLLRYWEATPVIHPIFARLARYRSPFNDIKPIGIGDLKVVKQKLIGYSVGEIANIHNVMKGEQSEQTNRTLNKSEDKVFISSDTTQLTENESQLSDKYEIKREADQVIKTDLKVNANAGFTYGGSPVVASISAGMSYQTSSEDAQKLSSNFARDVMDKALNRVESKVSQQRSSTRITEVEEITKHGFSNAGQGAEHMSGIFRWVDKKYRSQVYNYGKRLMFEFVVPEPAAFFIQSRIKAYEFYNLKIPEKPTYSPVSVSVKKDALHDLVPSDINSKAVLNAWKLKYDLAEFQFPENSKILSFRDKDSGNKTLQKNIGVAGDSALTADQYVLEIPEKGYVIKRVLTRGAMRYFQAWDNSDNADDSGLGGNKLIIEVNGVQVENVVDNRLYAPVERDTSGLNISMYDGKVTLDVLVQDLFWYTFSVSLFLELDPQYLVEWQNDVFRKITAIEQKKVDAINADLFNTFKLKLADYENQKRELQARAINDLIQGKSEAYNRDVILKELKKHCITLLAKEFDDDSTDDLISNKETMGTKSFKSYPVTKFVYEERDNDVVAGFQQKEVYNVTYPVIKTKEAKEKGSIIQFLEQAFEWQQLAYMFYPYFWAEEKKWISLMSHMDYTDKNMTDFLQAGSVRILLAVQPSYNHAVLHYLATREAWEGGNVPVIGDPLYLPLFEEIHKQQDDLHGAKKEGTPWEFIVPTSLIYLHGSKDLIPADDEFDTE